MGVKRDRFPVFGPRVYCFGNIGYIVNLSSQYTILQTDLQTHHATETLVAKVRVRCDVTTQRYTYVNEVINDRSFTT